MEGRFSQVEVFNEIMQLLWHDGPKSAAELSKLLNVSERHAARWFKWLLGKGWVERVECGYRARYEVRLRSDLKENLYDLIFEGLHGKQWAICTIN